MHEEAVELERELTADLGAATVLELYERFGYDPRGVDRDTSAYTSETDALYRGAHRLGPAAAASAWRSRTRRSRRLHPPLARSRSSTPGSRPSAPSRRSARRWPASGSTSTPSETSSSTSSPARASARGRSAPRSASPAGSCWSSCRRAGRTTTRRSSTRRATPSTSRTPTRRCRPSSGSWATTPSRRASRSCFEHLLSDPALAPLAARLRARRRLRPLHRAPEAVLRAPLRGQAGVRDRAPLRDGARVPARPLRRAPLGGRRSPLSRAATTWRTSTAASTAPATCGPGRSRPSCATT